MSGMMILFSVVISIAGVVFLVYGFNRLHKFQLIQDTPTSKIRSMAMGLVEVHVNVSGTQFIKTPFSKSDCVYYEYRVEEYRRHTRTDSKGRTRTYYSWDTIASGERAEPFYVKDETGEVFVRPKGAEIQARLKKIFYQRSGFLGAFGTIIRALKDWDSGGSEVDVSSWALQPYHPGHHSSFGAMVGDRKYYESYIEPGENLYILGSATPASGEADQVWIGKGENEPTFMISYKSEKELASSLKWTVWGLFILGVILITIGVIVGLYNSSY